MTMGKFSRAKKYVDAALKRFEDRGSESKDFLLYKKPPLKPHLTDPSMKDIETFTGQVKAGKKYTQDIKLLEDTANVKHDISPLSKTGLQEMANKKRKDVRYMAKSLKKEIDRLGGKKKVVPKVRRLQKANSSLEKN